MDDRCPIVDTINLVGKRHHLLVLRYLMDGPKRFNELKRDLEGVSSRTLSATLDRLAQEEILRREVRSESPIAVWYGLTPKGRDLVTVLRHMQRWGGKWLQKPGRRGSAS